MDYSKPMLRNLVLLLTCFIFGHTYDLRILHTNDIHAYYEQFSKSLGECSDDLKKQGMCFGGEARRRTIIEQGRKTHPNTLVLDAGDRFTGSLWFTTYKGAASAHFINKEKYDAVCLGNHDFDLGLDGLIPYLENLTMPVVDANIDVSNEPRLQGLFNRSMVIEKGGEKIGIVGFITTDTAFLSKAGPTVKFTDEVQAVNEEVEKLKANGIKIIIGLSHAGYEMDKVVAGKVNGIDIIVGGHSHTFLYTGEAPSTETIGGPYPTVITQASGRNVLILNAYAWGKYIGYIDVNFDENLEVKGWSGDPVLLDNRIPQDAEILADIQSMKKPLEEMKSSVIGSSAVRLQTERCQEMECNAGNLITDAIVWYHLNGKVFNDTWALAPIALKNSGSMKTEIEPGPVTQGQVFTLMPYLDFTNMIRIKGSYVWEAFEHSVANYRPDVGAFLQVSGVRVVYNLRNPPGKRVVSLEVRCQKCLVPSYSPIQMHEVYNLLLDDWLIRGGDGYDMWQPNFIERIQLDSPIADSISAYFKANRNIFPEVEGRIKFLQAENTTCPETWINAAGTPYIHIVTVVTQSVMLLLFIEAPSRENL